MKSVKIILLFIGIVIAISSCQVSYDVIGHGIVLKDSIQVFNSPKLKDQKPVEVWNYGTDFDIVLEKGKETLPDVYSILKDGKVYYVRQEDVYTNVKVVEGGKQRKKYLVLNNCMIWWKDGASIHQSLKIDVIIKTNKEEPLEVVYITNFTPSDYSSVMWGTRMYILFEPNTLITPPQFYTATDDERSKLRKDKTYYYLVMDMNNPAFVGYVKESAVDLSTVPGVIAKEVVKVYSSPSASAKEVGTVNIFELVSLEESDYGGYLKIKSMPFSSNPKKGYISIDDVSTNVNDVLFTYKLRDYTNYLLDISSLDEQKKTEIESFFNNFISQNPSSKIYSYVWNLYRNIFGYSGGTEYNEPQGTSEGDSE